MKPIPVLQIGYIASCCVEEIQPPDMVCQTFGNNSEPVKVLVPRKDVLFQNTSSKWIRSTERESLVYHHRLSTQQNHTTALQQLPFVPALKIIGVGFLQSETSICNFTAEVTKFAGFSRSHLLL